MGSMLASDNVDLVFQQHDELMGLPSVAILGPLSGETSGHLGPRGGVLAISAGPGRAAALLDLIGFEAAGRTAPTGGKRAACQRNRRIARTRYSGPCPVKFNPQDGTFLAALLGQLPRDFLR